MLLPLSLTKEAVPVSTDAEWEQDLLHRFRRGEQDAFGTLLRHYERRAFSLTLRLVGRPAEAEEVLQEAFLQAFSAAPRFRRIDPFRPWLYRIVVNVCRNHNRHSSRREVPHELSDARLAAEAGRDASPEDELLGAVNAAALEEALAVLDEKDRLVFLLKAHEDLSYAEIKKVTGGTERALRVRYHRTLKKLRELLYGGLQ